MHRCTVFQLYYSGITKKASQSLADIQVSGMIKHMLSGYNANKKKKTGINHSKSQSQLGGTCSTSPLSLKPACHDVNLWAILLPIQYL